MGKTALVTGGAGFIGSHLIEALIKEGFHVVIIDNLSTGPKPSSGKSIFFNQDILNPAGLKSIFSKVKPDVVFHLAAIAQVNSTNPSQMLKVNVQGTKNIINLSKQAKVKHFFFTSSAAVYGNSHLPKLNESSLKKPISGYGQSKLTAEKFIQQSNLPSTIFRFANVFGPRQAFNTEGGAIAIFFHQAMASLPITIYSDGLQTRDFIYVKDVVKAFETALTTNCFGLFNISSNQSITILKLAQKIIKLSSSQSKINFLPARLGDINHSQLDNSLAKKVLTWKPSYSFDSALKDYYAFLK